MSMTDPVGDLLTRIRNASKARKPAVDVPASKLKREIVRILTENKFLRDFVDLPDNKQGLLRIYLRYSRDDEPVIKGIERVSKPGLRQYVAAGDVRSSTFNMRGMQIISTSNGVMTNFDAAKRNIGGELIMRCW
jgi:small subunit ribosomal protein S8